MANRSETNDSRGKLVPREAGVRKGSLRGSQQINRGNAGSHQGDRDRSGNPAPGHTRGEERDRHNR
jgi:hypothetical protein